MFRSVSQKVVVLGIVLAAGATAAVAAVQSRITGQVSSASRRAIPDSVHAKARFGSDLGATAGKTRLEGMTLRFSMTDAQQAALEQLLADQQNPNSPRYHQWLTPEQYGAQFGLSSGDVAKVTSWLTGQGFSIDEVGKSGTFVRFTGTVAQAQTAFSTSIHNVAFGGQTYYANVTDATVPAALGSVVSGVTGLHNFKLKARVRSRQVQALAAHPLFTSSITGNHYIAPGDFYTIYNETPLFSAGLDGTGVSVAVMGQVDINLADVGAFRAASGLTPNLPSVRVFVSDPGAAANCSAATNANCPTPNLDDLEESALDAEWAGASAPGANIIFVASPNVIADSLTDAIDNNLAPIMSVSYGDCEQNWSTSDRSMYNQLFMQANAQGITVVGPAGDDGATDCDASDTSAAAGLAVDFPASSPYVTSIGGTMYNEGSTTGATSYWAGTDSSISAGTSVTSATASALSYIPEAAWNEDATGSEFSAGGGGASLYFAKPTWQTGAGVPADNLRDVPDLALNSAAAHDGYLYCVSNSCVNGTYRAADGQSLTVAGGTSFATPSFAGILAIVEQNLGSRIGNANPTIYALANSSAYANVFHDVTTGNNNSVCTKGTTGCPNGGSIGYSAGVGYDQVTGWGSINAYNLAKTWPAVSPITAIATGSADFSLTPASTTITLSSASGTGNSSFTVVPMNGFTGQVTFTATSLSTTSVTPTFSFSPATVTGSGATTLTVSFPTVALRGSGPLSSGSRSKKGVPTYGEEGGAVALACLVFCLPGKKRLRALIAIVVSVAAVGGMSGCGVQNTPVSATSTSSSTGSAVGSYEVVVTGTYTNASGLSAPLKVTHSVAVNLVVQ